MFGIIVATILGLVAGISGTLSGGLLVLAKREAQPNQQAWLLGFSGAIMVVVVVFDLWPEAWHFGGPGLTVIGTVIGMLLVQSFEPLLELLPWYQKKRFSKFAKVGLLLGLGIGVHNFPEGVALGTTYIANPAINGWMALALLMAIHNIPEGMVMTAAFKIGKVSWFKIVLSLFLVELPMAFGGGIGAYLGGISPAMISLSLGFAGGAMFLLVAKELLPLAKKIAGTFWVGSGFICGFFFGILMVSLI